MARPRKSTLDAWLDQFAEWSAEDRAFALGQIQAINRAITVAERRTAEPAVPPSPAAASPSHAALSGPATLFVGDKRVESISDLDRPDSIGIKDLERNAALDLEDGTKQ